ncbi:hypothetical protein BC829DRAFT_287208 [Chytridium lagenaria]|nr:hypothetical protein BC829DRAFT_287208 [Chytridium lagenaria]
MNDDEESGDEGGSDEVDERDRESAGSESSVKRRRKSDEEEGVDLTLLSVKGEDSRISMNIAQAEGVEIDDEKPHVETSASTIETDEIQPIKVSDGGSFTVVSADPVNLSNATSILSSPPAASPTHDSIAVAAEPERSHIVSQLPPLPDSPVTKKESKYRLTYVQATRQKVAAVYLRVKERRGLVEYRQRLKLALDEEGRKVWGIV